MGDFRTNDAGLVVSGGEEGISHRWLTPYPISDDQAFAPSVSPFADFLPTSKPPRILPDSYEFWKKVAIDTFGVDKARENRQAIYLGASGIAEFFADIALCPLEATRIRLVSQPTFANGLAGGFARIAREEGLGGFYAG